MPSQEQAKIRPVSIQRKGGQPELVLEETNVLPSGKLSHSNKPIIETHTFDPK